MKAILEFNLPEDQIEFDLASNAANMHDALWEMDQWLRSQTKYAPDDMDRSSHATYEHCRTVLNDIMTERDVKLI